MCITVCVFSDDAGTNNKSPDSHLTASKKLYDLTKKVKVWSDFLRPHFHPNTIYLLDDTQARNGRVAGSDGENFWGFPSGYSIFQKEEVEDEITDRIRRLAEPCNSLQVG